MKLFVADGFFEWYEYHIRVFFSIYMYLNIGIGHALEHAQILHRCEQYTVNSRQCALNQFTLDSEYGL